MVSILFSLVATAAALGVVELPMQKRQTANSASTLPESNLINSFDIFYTVTLQMGNPPQDVDVMMDTGSSDLVVIDSSNPLCAKTDADYSSDQTFILCPSTFDSSSSKTYKVTKDKFRIRYGDTTTASGVRAKDTIRLDKFVTTGLRFGLGLVSNSSQNVLGIGLLTEESSYAYSNFTYPNFPQLLARQGLVQSPAYSMYLGPSGHNGSVLFGGYDKSKYYEPLVTLPIVDRLTVDKFYDLNDDTSVDVIPAEFMLNLDQATLTNAKGEKDVLHKGQQPVLLDSGTSFIMLPDPILEKIVAASKAEFNDTLGLYALDCFRKDTFGGASVDFQFGDALVKIPLSKLILTASSLFSDMRPDQCVLPIVSSHDSYSILGDAFLRFAYVVYDLRNYAISIAQAKDDGGPPDVYPITKKGIAKIDPALQPYLPIKPKPASNSRHADNGGHRVRRGKSHRSKKQEAKNHRRHKQHNQ